MLDEAARSTNMQRKSARFDAATRDFQISVDPARPDHVPSALPRQRSHRHRILGVVHVVHDTDRKKPVNRKHAVPLSSARHHCTHVHWPAWHEPLQQSPPVSQIAPPCRQHIPPRHSLVAEQSSVDAQVSPSAFATQVLPVQLPLAHCALSLQIAPPRARQVPDLHDVPAQQP
jgi:hypothetical protein